MAETLHVPFVAGEYVRLRGGSWRITDVRAFSSCATLSLHGADPATFGTSRTVIFPFDRPSRLPRRLTPSVVPRRRGLRAIAELIATSHPYDGLRAAATARIELLGFQLEPALAILRGLASRILLADEVGLGKTIQAGLVLAELYARGDASHTLIIVPSGMRDQWANELSTHFGFKPEIVDLAALTAASSEVPAGMNPWSVPAIRIVSIDFIKRPEVSQSLSELFWDLLIIDEAHHLSSSTDRGAAARLLAARSRHVLLLTATPHSGDQAEFQSLCAIGGGATDSTAVLMFRRSRAQVGFSDDRRVRLLAIRPSTDEARLHAMLDQYARDLWLASGSADPSRAAEVRLLLAVLYKRAFSSASSLLASLRRRWQLLEGAAVAQAEPEQSTLLFGEEEEMEDIEPAGVGAPGMKDTMQEVERLRMLVDAAHCAARSESKLRVIRALLRRTPERMIIFTEYRDTLLRIAAEIAPQPLAILHGGMTRRERRSAEESFTHGNARVLLATDAAGEGLNLQHDCRLVMSLELPWSPLRLEQRIGRVDRIGQRRRVHAIALLAHGTAETRVLARLVAKVTAARRSLGDVSQPLAGIREHDVLRSFFESEGDLERPAPVTPQPYRLLDLGQKAKAERVRLETVRRCAPSLVRTQPTPAPFIVRAGRRTTDSHTRACVFIYRICIRDGARATLEDLVVPIAAFRGATALGTVSQSSAARLLANLSNRELKAAVSRLAEILAPDIEQHLLASVGNRMPEIEQLHRAVRHLRETRETGLRQVLVEARAEAVRRVAQQSLFYRNADEATAAALEGRLASETVCLDLRLLRLRASRELCVDPAELIGVLPL